MKRWVLAMLILVDVLLAGNITFSGHGYAAQIPQYDNTEYLPQTINRISGDWYNANNKLVLSIKDSYINDCQVVKLLNLVGGSTDGGGIFTIAENSGSRDLQIGWHVHGNEHDVLSYGGKTLYKQSAGYFESVDGVHLGMTKAQIIAQIGAPDTVGTHKDDGDLLYSKRGMEVSLSNDSVVGITIRQNGTAHFDRTGFDCRTSLDSYYKAYKLDRRPSPSPGPDTTNGAYGIGHGEYLIFDEYPHSISITIYCT
jgi:hypothetical protein